MNLLIGPDKVYFNYVFVFKVLKKVASHYIGFKLADPDFVTALRIFHTF
jgi:hypothetical protein